MASANTAAILWLRLASRSSRAVGLRAISTQTSFLAKEADPKLGVATHTGQEWSDNDIRQVRFLEYTKQTNENWAINLIKEIEPIEVDNHIVSCDGGGGALGHPRVYINLDAGEPRECIYCQLRFVYKPKQH